MKFRGRRIRFPISRGRAEKMKMDIEKISAYIQETKELITGVEEELDG